MNDLTENFVTSEVIPAHQFAFLIPDVLPRLLLASIFDKRQQECRKRSIFIDSDTQAISFLSTPGKREKKNPVLQTHDSHKFPILYPAFLLERLS